MPSTSEKQLHFMRMVKAVAAGHEIKGVSKATNAALHDAADSMTAQQVEDFQTLAKPKPKSLLRR